MVKLDWSSWRKRSTGGESELQMRGRRRHMYEEWVPVEQAVLMQARKGRPSQHSSMLGPVRARNTVYLDVVRGSDFQSVFDFLTPAGDASSRHALAVPSTCADFSLLGLEEGPTSTRKYLVRTRT